MSKDGKRGGEREMEIKKGLYAVVRVACMRKHGHFIEIKFFGCNQMWIL